jgi:hypothetical protein
MAKGRQSFTLPLRRDELSETYAATALFSAPNCCRTPNPLQIAAFRPGEGPCDPQPPTTTPHTPPDSGAKHRCDPHEAGGLANSPTVLTAESFKPRREGGVGTAGDREEGENRTSRQAYSGRPARMVIGLVPEASNGPASRQLGEAGFQRSNRSSACQSREQRHTGPRTPLHVNEGRPRARYDKKESNRCSQVEYDSC